MIDYDAHRWAKHLFDIRGSMVREIMYRVATCVLWSVAVVWADVHFEFLRLPPLMHTLLGTALGLLLVFRTNASYDRFWEGRKLWGGIVNESRNLARISKVLISHTDPRLHNDLIKWCIAWVYAAMHSLRGRKDIGPMGDLLPKGSVKATLEAQHVPLAIATRMSEMINDARKRGMLSDIQQVSVDNNVQQLIDYLGGCERIVKTPLPFAYVVHLRRALVMYTFTLPFAIYKDFGWWTVMIVFIVSYIFFGIEEIGVQIEDPFGYDENDLPLERICATIENNLLGLTDGETFHQAPGKTAEKPSSAA